MHAIEAIVPKNDVSNLILCSVAKYLITLLYSPNPIDALVEFPSQLFHHATFLVLSQSLLFFVASLQALIQHFLSKDIKQHLILCFWINLD